MLAGVALFLSRQRPTRSGTRPSWWRGTTTLDAIAVPGRDSRPRALSTKPFPGIPATDDRARRERGSSCTMSASRARSCASRFQRSEISRWSWRVLSVGCAARHAATVSATASRMVAQGSASESSGGTSSASPMNTSASRDWAIVPTGSLPSSDDPIYGGHVSTSCTVHPDRRISDRAARWVDDLRRAQDGRGWRVVAFPVELGPLIEAHLAEYVKAAPDSLVFTSRDGLPLRRTKFRPYWANACNKAQIAGLHFHDLRGSGATWAATAGATVRELMTRLGHATPAVTSVTNMRRSSAIGRSLTGCRAPLKTSDGEQDQAGDHPPDHGDYHSLDDDANTGSDNLAGVGLTDPLPHERQLGSGESSHIGRLRHVLGRGQLQPEIGAPHKLESRSP